MFRKLSLAAMALAAFTTTADASDAMNDLEIAHTAYTAGNLDIRYAHLALAISENAKIREFAKRDELAGLRGKAFDCAYATNELGYHEVVNKTVETSFIPAVTVPRLKTLLQGALATFKVHEGQARKMVAGLNCGA